MRNDFNPQPEGSVRQEINLICTLMTVEKISDVLAHSNDVKITSPFELNIWVESCGSYFDTFTKEDDKRMIAPNLDLFPAG